MTGTDAKSRPVIRLDVLEPESCEGCGVCCEGVGSPVLLYASHPREPDPHPFRPPDLPAELLEEIDRHFAGLIRGQEPQERCLWFDPESRRCRHYEWRPQFCREYEVGGPACLIERRPYVRDSRSDRAPDDPPDGRDDRE